MADLLSSLNRQYKDVSLAFTRNPVTHDVVSVTGDEAVKRSIKNLLMTRAGEVPFFPEFGTSLNDLLFEPIDPITTALLETEIQAVIEAYEPRVRIQSLVVTPSEDENAYNIRLTFNLVNMSQPITLTLLLSRLR